MPAPADRVDVVIGVDTHKHSHTEAVVSSTGGVLRGQTVASTDAGYRSLLALADEHPGRRARVIGIAAQATRRYSWCNPPGVGKATTSARRWEGKWDRNSARSG